MSRRPSWWLGFLKLYWPLNYISARATRLPVLGKILFMVIRPLFSKSNFNITYLPVNESIKGAGSLVLAARIIEELIEKSAHRVIINRCSCRDSGGCAVYPVEDSCLLMGEGARHIDSRISRHISKEEAVAHLRKKLELGLIPMVGRVRMDDFYYGVPNHGKLLTICFCCPCCCTILKSSRYLPEEVSNSLVRVKGLAIAVDQEQCSQCGTCIGNCFMKAISLENGRIVHADGLCKGCGRCAQVCPEGAVSMHLRDISEAIDEIYGRIRERIDIE